MARSQKGWATRPGPCVGQALGANSFAPIVPCHRVLGAKGR
ncbi:MGMT family protein [Xenophilus aerolatus]